MLLKSIISEEINMVEMDKFESEAILITGINIRKADVHNSILQRDYNLIYLYIQYI